MFKNLVAASAMSMMAMVGLSGQSMALTLDGGNSLVDSVLSDGINGDGGNVDALDGGFYGASFVTLDAAGNAVFNFINNSASSVVLSIADLSVNQAKRQNNTLLNYFTGGLSGWWVGEEFNTVSFAAGVTSGVNGLSTLIGAGGVATFVVAFGDPVKLGGTNSRLGFQLQVNSETVIPLPLPIMLLGTALIGMGALGRRRKSAK